MTPEQAADLAARTLATIDAYADLSRRNGYDQPVPNHAADRERVASDLAGLRLALACRREGCACPSAVDHAARYADGLRRTAALYGVTE